MSLVPSLPYRYTYSYTASLIIAFHWTFETFYPILSRWFCTLSQLLSPSHSQCSCPLPRTRLEEKEPNKILLTAHNPLIQCFKGTQIPKFSVNRQSKTVTLSKKKLIRVSPREQYRGWLWSWQIVVANGCCCRRLPEPERPVPDFTGSENLTLTQTQNFQLSLWLSVENNQHEKQRKEIKKNESRI